MDKTTFTAKWLLLAASFPLLADEKYGKLHGNNQSECSDAVSQFFSLSKFGRHGFDPWKTFIKRHDFLGDCPTVDPAVVSDIMKRFGKMRG
ncbi:MAG: hypothetical protein ACR5LC_08300 [Symbiopectobacterium sp.]|uniref:hypothetical protein n=1 Tax=Symbiopectobacterium sp. TaxID=2952789 RepID=UPI003F36B241